MSLKCVSNLADLLSHSLRGILFNEITVRFSNIDSYSAEDQLGLRGTRMFYSEKIQTLNKTRKAEESGVTNFFL